MVIQLSKYWPTEKDLLLVHEAVQDHCATYDGAPMAFSGERSKGGAANAVTAPLASFGGEDLYPTLNDKVGILAYSINANHTFRDGNKRTSLATICIILRKNGYRLDVKPNDLPEFIIQVAATTSSMNYEYVANWLHAHMVKSSMDDRPIKEIVADYSDDLAYLVDFDRL